MSYDKAILPDEVILWTPDYEETVWIVMVGENNKTQRILFDDHGKATEFAFSEAKRLGITVKYADL